MRRFFVLFALMQFALISFSQNMTINFKDGKIKRYNMGDIESVNFSESNGEEIPIDDDDPDLNSLVGVWENGNYFLSFSNDGFLCAYFEDEYLDCGNYSINNNIITCNNAYYAKLTKYSILKLTDNSIEVNIEYNSMAGKDLAKTISFNKNPNKAPSIKDHSLVGKSITSFRLFGGEYNYLTWSFDTYNTGTKSWKSGVAGKWPLKVYYVYFDEKIYVQTFRTYENMPTIGGWNPSKTVSISKVEFNSDGSIFSISALD